MGAAVAEIMKMPLSERLEAVEAIWESIASNPKAQAMPLTEAQSRELDARLDAYERDPKAGDSWDIVHDRIRSRNNS